MNLIPVKPDLDDELAEMLASPAWRVLFIKMEEYRADLLTKAARSLEDHPRRLGRLEGAEAIITYLRTAVEARKV